VGTYATFWPGSGSYPAGKTAFGYFDDSDTFVDEAPKVANWVCASLGYPVMAVELEDAMIYKQFEAAIMEYSSQVYEFNIRENLMSLQGQPTGTSLNGRVIANSPLPYVVEISEYYGSEAGTGGNLDWKKGYVDCTTGQQEYDLQNLWAAVSESGNRIVIRRIFHDRTPAISRGGFGFGDMGVGPTDGTNNLLGEFGWAGYDGGLNGSTGGGTVGQFMVMPMYETLLRTQAIEFNDQIRRSQYSFELVNNKIKIFPMPETGDRLYFQYSVRNEANVTTGSLGNISDFSNVPYNFMSYDDINSVGKRWIYKYTLALCKLMLGRVLSKYENVPTPSGEGMRLDGPQLRQEGAAEIDKMIDQLRESLLEAGRAKQMEKMAENEQYSQDILRKVPLLFYIL